MIELADLPLGWRAWRDSPARVWRREAAPHGDEPCRLPRCCRSGRSRQSPWALPLASAAERQYRWLNQKMRPRTRCWGPLLLLLLLAVACDPGLSYVIPGAKVNRGNGTRYVMSIDQGVEARFYAGVFIRNGSSEIQVINTSDRPITFTPVPTSIFDANGAAVESSGCWFSAGASGSTSRVLLDAGRAPSILRRGHMATVRCSFGVEFANGSSYSREFERMTFIQTGFTENGRQIPVRAAMVWGY